MSRYLAFFFGVALIVTSGCTSQLSNLGDLIPTSLGGVRAMLFGDRKKRAEALSVDHARLAARICARYVFESARWEKQTRKAIAAPPPVSVPDGVAPDLFPETVWSFRDTPLIFFWPVTAPGRGCAITAYSGERDAVIATILTELGVRGSAKSADAAHFQDMTFKSLQEAPFPPSPVTIGGVAYYVSVRVMADDDPFAQSGPGLFLAVWRKVADGPEAADG